MKREAWTQTCSQGAHPVHEEIWAVLLPAEDARAGGRTGQTLLRRISTGSAGPDPADTWVWDSGLQNCGTRRVC